MGILAGSSGAGVLVFGLFAGAWADRLRRRPILIAADLARAALLGTIPLAAALHRLNMAHLYAVATLAGILTVLFDVSYQAYVPSLVNRAKTLWKPTASWLSPSPSRTSPAPVSPASWCN